MIEKQQENLFFMLYKLGRPEDLLIELKQIKFSKDAAFHSIIFKAAQACLMLNEYERGKKLISIAERNYNENPPSKLAPNILRISMDIDQIMYFLMIKIHLNETNDLKFQMLLN